MSIVSYRCVCGSIVPLDKAEGGRCAICGRHYSGDVLRVAFAETVQFAEASTESVTDGKVSTGDNAWIGKKLNHYEIVSRLGEGGMGCVYRALDLSLQRYVALKVIRPCESSSTDTRQLQRLFQEAIAQARVNHPNVVHIYYVGREGESPFLAMELVDGETLAQCLAAGPLPFADVVGIAMQVADALRHSVNFDILHGDIKPNNILLTSSGVAKLSDFGLARRLSQSIELKSGIAGTPAYMAPEAIEATAVDVRSDMYSLGITLFEMTFGRLPYSLAASSVAECIENHRTAEIEFPDPWPIEVPLGWRDVVKKLLAKSPNNRYQTYGELLCDLRALRPAKLPGAGRVQRVLAWFVDLALVNTIMTILTAPLRNDDLLPALQGRPVGFLLVMLVGASAPLMASAIQAYWRTTPGKKLFQIRVVDRHGLAPTQPAMAGRMAFQMLPLWSVAFDMGLQGFLLPLAGLVIGVTMIIDIACGILRRDGRALHDLLFDTRVVLDVSMRLDETTD